VMIPAFPILDDGVGADRNMVYPHGGRRVQRQFHVSGCFRKGRSSSVKIVGQFGGKHCDIYLTKLGLKSLGNGPFTRTGRAGADPASPARLAGCDQTVDSSR
jgi:hypothetical protein